MKFNRTNDPTSIEIAQLLTTHNPKGGVSSSKDSFVVNQTFVFHIKFCGKRPALRVAAKRCGQLIASVERDV